MDKRHQIAFILFISYCFFVYFRKLFSLLIPEILKEIHLNEREIGLIASVQCGSYAIGKFLFGVASDWFPPRVILVTGLTGVTLAIQMMSLSTCAAHFVIAAAINGFLQGTGWPPILKIIRERYSPVEFGTMFTIMACSNNVAGFLGPFTLVLSWRRTASVTGFIAFILCAYLWFTLDQTSYNASNDSLKSETTSEEKPKKPVQQNAWRKIISCESVWVASTFYSFAMITRTTMETWMPVFVAEHISSADAVQTFFVFELAGFIGTVVSGYICDLLSSKMQPDNARVLLGATTTFAMLFTLGLLFSSVWTQTLASLVGFFLYANINILGIIDANLFEPSFVGSCNAFISVVGNGMAMLCGTPLAILITSYGYSAINSVSTLLLLLSFTVLFFARNCSLHIKVE